MRQCIALSVWLSSYIKIHQLKIIKTFWMKRQFNWFLNAKSLKFGNVYAFCFYQTQLEVTAFLFFHGKNQIARISSKPTIEWLNNPINCIDFNRSSFAFESKVDRRTALTSHSTALIWSDDSCNFMCALLHSSSAASSSTYHRHHWNYNGPVK